MPIFKRRPLHPAEQVLKDHGQLGWFRSKKMPELLGCLAAHMEQSAADPGIGRMVCSGFDISRCANNDLRPGEAQPLLRTLETAGVLGSEWDTPHEIDRPRRMLYSPVESELSKDFMAAVAAANTCGIIDDGQNPTTT